MGRERSKAGRQPRRNKTTKEDCVVTALVADDALQMREGYLSQSTWIMLLSLDLVGDDQLSAGARKPSQGEVRQGSSGWIKIAVATRVGSWSKNMPRARLQMRWKGWKSKEERGAAAGGENGRLVDGGCWMVGMTAAETGVWC
jgi:hypothetical protein